MTFENHCLEEEMTFSDLFEDSGVARYAVAGLRKIQTKEQLKSAVLQVCKWPISVGPYCRKLLGTYEE